MYIKQDWNYVIKKNLLHADNVENKKSKTNVSLENNCTKFTTKFSYLQL